MQGTWGRVDEYLGDLLAPEDAHLKSILETNGKLGLPPIDVPALLGQFLALMVRITGPRRVLEIGTLGGYSTLWMARALLPGGRLQTLEIDPDRAALARTSLTAAGVGDRIEVLVGPAAETMRRLQRDGVEPFDLFFLDADKKGLPEYLELSLKLARPGSIIIADNVVRDGKVIDPANPDPDVKGVRQFLKMMAEDARLQATAIPTVGARGYDGFSMAMVTDL